MGNCPLSAMRKMQKVYEAREEAAREAYHQRGKLIEELRKQIPQPRYDVVVRHTMGKNITHENARFERNGTGEYRVLSMEDERLMAIYPENIMVCIEQVEVPPS
jgi:hypothetical protein